MRTIKAGALAINSVLTIKGLSPIMECLAHFLRGLMYADEREVYCFLGSFLQRESILAFRRHDGKRSQHFT